MTIPFPHVPDPVRICSCRRVHSTSRDPPSCPVARKNVPGAGISARVATTARRCRETLARRIRLLLTSASSCSDAPLVLLHLDVLVGDVAQRTSPSADFSRARPPNTSPKRHGPTLAFDSRCGTQGHGKKSREALLLDSGFFLFLFLL